MQRKRGNQPLSRHDKEKVVYRIEPYLKSGLSIRAACLESGVPRSTLYRVMDEEDDLRDQIYQFQNYISILTTVSLTRQMFYIKSKQDQDIPLTWDEIRFMMWFATHSRHCSEEFGRDSAGKNATIEVDPYEERRNLLKLIEAGNNKEN